MLTYELAWRVTREQLPLVLDEELATEAEASGIVLTLGDMELPVRDMTGVIGALSLELVEEDARIGLAGARVYRVRINDVDQSRFEKLLRGRASLISLELLHHEVDERPAWPVRDVPLVDGTVVDMHADSWTGDMMETRPVWPRGAKST